MTHSKELSEEQIAELYSKHEQIQKAVKNWADNSARNDVEESYNDGALDGAYIGFKHGIKQGHKLGLEAGQEGMVSIPIDLLEEILKAPIEYKIMDTVIAGKMMSTGNYTAGYFVNMVYAEILIEILDKAQTGEE